MEMICIAKCTAIHKESKAQGFSTLKVGDVLTFTATISSPGRGSRGTYAKCIEIKNNKTGEIRYQTFGEIDKRLSNYEFKQLNDKEVTI